MKKISVAKRVSGFVIIVSLLLASSPVTVSAQTLPTLTRAQYIQALDDIMVQLLKIQELLNALLAEEKTAAINDKTPVKLITVLVDHQKDSAEANVSYQTGAKKQLNIKSEKKPEIIRLLSRQLELKESEVESKTSFTFINADVLTKLLVTIQSSHNISLELTFADDRKIDQVVPTSTIDGLINSLFLGSISTYNSVFDSYVTEMKRGIKPPDIIDIIAGSVGLPSGQVSNVIEFKIAANYQSGTLQ